METCWQATHLQLGSNTTYLSTYHHLSYSVKLKCEPWMCRAWALEQQQWRPARQQRAMEEALYLHVAGQGRAMGPPNCSHEDNTAATAEDTGQYTNKLWSEYVAGLGNFHAWLLIEVPLMGSVFVMLFHDACGSDGACAPVPWLPVLGLLYFAAAGASAGALLWLRIISHSRSCP